MSDERPILVAASPAAAEHFAQLLARPDVGGCPLHAAPVPGLTAALNARWALIDERLRQAVPDTTYEIWLSALRLHRFGDVQVRVAAPPTIASWVSTRFTRVLEQAVADVAGGPRRVVVEVCDACTPRSGPGGRS